MEKRTAALPEEKPRNGVAGLKYWREDIVAGLLVSLISLPFSLGIAVASGAPPIAGLVSAIIAGLLLPFLGGSYVTISGPAAGLAPVLLATMTSLGHGNLERGYPLLLVVICMAGCVQIVLSLLHAARYSAIFPAAVVEGMLASIGLMIIVKQIPYVLGVKFHAHEFFHYLTETPEAIPYLNPRVLLLALVCLGMIFALVSLPWKALRLIPPQLTVVILGIVLGRLLGLSGSALIHLPDNVVEHGIVLPNFAGLLQDRGIWVAALVGVLTLTMVDGVESLATAQAIDKIDPFRRRSNPNRVLLAMGISNIASSIAGGLTIIPGGVKSKACVVGGGKTLWANFYNAIFLILFLFAAKPLINQIPLAALAAILIFTGYKMCEPKIWRHVAGIGKEQLALFSLTVVVTLATDLLIGIIAGIIAKLALNLWLLLRGRGVNATLRGIPEEFLGLFRSPVRDIQSEGDVMRLSFNRPMVCFNTLHVNEALGQVPPSAKHLYLEFEDGVTVIDHTSCENLIQYAEEFERSGRGEVEFVGMDLLDRISDHESCMRIRQINLPGMLPQLKPPGLGPAPLFDILSPGMASSALQGSARETVLAEYEPVSIFDEKGALVRLSMVPVARFSLHPSGELAQRGLVSIPEDPGWVGEGEEPERRMM